MRRFLILLFLSMFLLCGCPDPKEEPQPGSKMNVMKVDTKAATIFLNHYFNFFMRRDYPVMASFYGKELAEIMKNATAIKEPHPVGYTIEEGETRGNEIIYHVNVFSLYSKKTYASKDSYDYIVGLEKGKNVIVSILERGSSEILAKEGELVKKQSKQQEEGLVKLSSLPEYTVGSIALTTQKKLKIPSKVFGVCGFSPDGKTIAMVTYDRNSFIGLIKMQKDAEVFGFKTSEGKTDQSGGGGGGQNGAGGEGSGNPGKQQSQGNYEVKPLDILYDTVIQSICFSPDGKKMVLQYCKGGAASKLMMYDTDTAKIQQIMTDRQFPDGEYSFQNPYFENAHTLIFTTAYAMKNRNAEKGYVGTWNLNLTKGKIKKIE